MGNLDKRDFQAWDKLNEEERKSFSALILMRWMAGTADARQIVFLNELLNPVLFSLGKHPELQMKLLASASSGISQRYKWMGVKSGAKKVKGLKVIQEYFGYNTREATEAATLLKKDVIIEMANELGYQDDEIKKLKKELK
jgi:hypothetical protein